MTSVNSMTEDPICPRCGSNEAPLATKVERPGMSLPNIRRLRKCAACGSVFEPSCGIVVGLAIVACGVFMGYVCIQRLLPMSVEQGPSPSILDWALGILGCVGAVYLVAIGICAMKAPRSLSS